MSQRAIREYDAKRLFAQVSGRTYTGFLLTHEAEIDPLTQQLEDAAFSSWVVKPDQLFGKRGKYGLVGVDLAPAEVVKWIKHHRHEQVTIGDRQGLLDTFLVEPFVPHQEEYYIAFETKRTTDRILFSSQGGMEIEEQRESITSVDISVLEDLQEHHLDEITQDLSSSVGGHPEMIAVLIQDLFSFFRQQGCTYLEINPFCFDLHGEVHLLDMVARMDTCEAYRQPWWKEMITWVKPFGSLAHPAETVVEELDEKTGASLKLSVLNPEGRYRFLLGGGGASVIVMDAMAQLGVLDQVANYGELSGNPDEASNRAYVQTLLETMLAAGTTDQYLCLVGGIANFTDIYALVKPLTEVLSSYADQLRDRRVTILMRRGGIRAQQAMQLLQQTCEALHLRYLLLDDDHALTEILAIGMRKQ